MIEVQYINGKFLAKGEINWGIAGKSINSDFTEDGGIEMNIELADLQKERSRHYLDDKLKEKVEACSSELTGEIAAEILTEHFNSIISELDACQEQLNNYFLYRLIESLTETAFPFWEYEEAIVPGYDDINESVYTSELDDAVIKAYANLPEITSYQSPESINEYHEDIEAIFAKYLPMFNLKGLIDSIVNEGCSLDGTGIEVQFSDTWGNEFFCAAYENFQKGLSPIDWHNF